MKNGLHWRDFGVSAVSVGQAILRVLSRLIMPMFFKLTVRGSENLTGLRKPLLLIANHKSYFDPLIISNALAGNNHLFPLRFIAKDEFFAGRISGWFFSLIGAFPAFRGQGADKSLELPRDVLKKNGAMVFFPEGRCIREQSLGSGRIGAAIIAKEFSNLRVLPVAITNSYLIKYPKFFSRPTITVNFGKPEMLTQTGLAGQPEAVITENFMKQLSALYHV